MHFGSYIPRVIKDKIKWILINVNHIGKHVSIHFSVNVSTKTFLEGNNIIYSGCNILDSSIGFGTYISKNSLLTNTKVGRFCSIASDVIVVRGAHPTKKFVSSHPAFFSTIKQAGFTFVEANKFEEFKYADKEKNYSVTIGNDVWIGQSVLLMEGVNVGDGAIVGSGAVVTNNIEPFSINVGIPSKVIGYRFNAEEIEFLNKYRWWDKDFKFIQHHAGIFNDISEFMKVNKTATNG